MSRFFCAVSSGVAVLIRTKLPPEKSRLLLAEITTSMQAGLSESSGESSDTKTCSSSFVVAVLRMVIDEHAAAGSLRSILREACILLAECLEYLYDHPATVEFSGLTWDVLRSELSALSTALCVGEKKEMIREENEQWSGRLPSATTESVLRALQAILRYSIGARSMRKHLLSIRNVPTLGAMLSTVMNIYGEDNCDPDIRLSALSVVGLLCEDDGADVLANYVPAVFGHLYTTLTTHVATTNVKLFEESAKLLSTFTNCVLCSADVTRKAFESDREVISHAVSSTLVDRRDEQWISKVKKKVRTMLLSIASHLTIHRSADVRLAFVDTVLALRQHYDDKLMEPLLDIVLILGEDTDSRIRSRCNAILMETPFFALADFGYSRLDKIAESLPVSVREGTESSAKPLRDQLLGVLRLLRHQLCALSQAEDAALVRTIRAIAESIRVDMSRLAISAASEEERQGGFRGFMTRIPLQFSISSAWIADASAALSAGGCDMLRLLVSIFSESSPSDKLSLMLLMTLLIDSIKENDTVETCCDPPASVPSSSFFQPSVEDYDLVCCGAVEAATNVLECVKVEDDEKEDRVEDKSRGHSVESCSAAAALVVIGASTAAIKVESKRNRVLVNALYKLLEWSTVQTNYLVSEAAQQGMEEVAKSLSLSVSGLMLKHGSHVVNKVAIAAMRYSMNRRCPLVLVALLDRLDSPELFRHTRLVVEDLLKALDRYNLDWCVCVLRVLRSFVRALNRWWPDAIDEEKAEKERTIRKNEIESENAVDAEQEDCDMEEPKKKSLPKSIALAEDVLKRTKHLLSSSHFVIRLVTLDVLSESLWHVRDFDDVLLPMVHQNWAALRSRVLEDKEMLARAAAIKVVSRMATVSGSFIQRRWIDEMWPSIRSWLLEQLELRTVNASHSSGHKYLVAVLVSLPIIWTSTAIRTTSLNEEVLRILNDFHSEPQLAVVRELSERGRRQIEDWTGKEEM